MTPNPMADLPPELLRAIARAEPVGTTGGGTRERIVGVALLLATLAAALAFALA